MPSSTSSKQGASDASSKPVWATGPEQITAELLFGGTYEIDVDIAKRMNIIHELRTSKDLVTVTACSVKDFEEVLTFCANDRSASQPATPTLARIQSELDPTPAVPTPRKATRNSIGRVAPVTDSDAEDESYVPSDSEEEESEDEEEEEEEEADEDVGAELEDLRAERKEHGEASSPTTGVAKRLANLSIAKEDKEDDEEEEEEDESYVPSSDSEASDSGDEYSDTDMADVGTAAIKAERDEFKAKQQQGVSA